MLGRLFRFLVLSGFVLGLLAVIAGVSAGLFYYFQVVKGLPDIETIRDYQPKAVTQIVGDDGTLIAEVYDEYRYPVSFQDIPETVRNAFLAAEDASFYQHQGIDFISILRAVWKNFIRKSTVQGASTITQQVVKSLLLSSKKTYERKAKEAILAYRMERALTKDQILTLYLNQIYLGAHAYGIKAAAKVYFHKDLKDLSVAEAAFLAGLPQKPSVYSKPKYRDTAMRRQKYVIHQMLRNKMITPEEAEEAREQKLTIHPSVQQPIQKAPYFASFILKHLDSYIEKGEPGSTAKNPGGFVVHTTADVKATELAERALQEGLQELDKRRGWRGPLLRNATPEDATDLSADQKLNKDDIYKAFVREVSPKTGIAIVEMGAVKGKVSLKKARWARRLLKSPPNTKNPTIPIVLQRYIKQGDIIEVSPDERSEQTSPEKESISSSLFRLNQTPEVEGAFVLINPLTGAVKVMVGGYDYKKSVFNRATQALRQPGSSFKPFVYLTAIEELDYTPSTILPDSPIKLVAGDGKLWEPQNYDHKFLGPMTMRTALQRSRNIISVYLIIKLGVDKVIETARRFGITTPIGHALSISLGSAEVKLIEMVRAYGVFAAGGWLLEPMYITSIENINGKEIYHQRPHYRERVISEDSAFIMANMMKGVVERGTAQNIKKLNRPVAGKTGTTNEQMDAWFIGYTPEWAAGVWVGFDVKKTLGRFETGGKAAAPIFLKFMQEFLKDTPPSDFEIPDGVIPVLVNLENGRLANTGDTSGFVEYFKSGTEPMKSQEDVTVLQNYLSNDEF